MGVIRWLDRIDPRRWEEACERLASAPPSNVDEATEYLAAFGMALSESISSSFADVEEEPEILPSVLNGLLEEAVKEESWELDKSLSHGFERLPNLIPELKPLNMIIDFHDIDVDVPSVCAPSDSGLFGCLSPNRLDVCAAALRQFASLADVRAALRSRRPSILQRALGRLISGHELATKLEDQYFESNWAELVRAVNNAHSHHHYLGLGMSA